MATKEKLLKRKNFFAAAVIAFMLWIVWIFIFFFVPPERFSLPLIFIFVTFLTILFTGSLLFASTRRGLLLSLGVVIFMLLRYFEIGNYLNLILLSGILLSIEYYLTKDKE